MGKKVWWDWLDKDSIIVPDEMQVRILYNYDATSAGGLVVKRRDVRMIWSCDLQLLC